MFRDFIKTQDFLKLPISGKGIFVNTNGVVTDNNNTIIKTFEKDKELYVSIDWFDGCKEYLVAIIVALTFKPVFIPIKNWKKLEILYKDGNKQNIHPSNLVWKFPKEGIECNSYPGYYYIPGYTRYVINKDGIIIKTLTNKKCKPYLTNKGYIRVTVVNDITGEKNNIGLHRLLAMTFLEYDEYVDSLHVNHIDNNKENNDISNLEWCTPEHNVHHSFINGNRKKIIEYSGNNNRSILVKNILTNEIVEYRTRYDCYRKLNIDKDIISYLCNSKDQPIYKGILQFKYKDDLSLWRVIENLEQELLLANKTKKVLVRNIETGEIKEFDSQKECAQYYKTVDAVISNRVKTKGQVLFPGGLQFKLKSDTTPWKDFSSVENEIRKHDGTRGVVVRNIKTKEIKEYYSCSDCCKDLNILPGVLNWRLTKKGEVVYPPGLQFKYKDDTTPWKDVCNDLIGNKVKKAIKVVNIKTNESKTYVSLRQCSIDLNINRIHIIKSIKNNTLYQELLFSYN